MLIRRIITLLFTILIGGNLLYAQGNAERLSGEWQITTVEMKLFSQEDNSLLEAKVFTADSTIRTVNARVPVKVHFEGMNYVLQFKGSVESGTYSTQDSLIILKSALQPTLMPGISYRYFFKNDTSMEIGIPTAFYRDNIRNLAVKLECSCSFIKKK
jgi:hypothetical protein